jgi:hypothetical protein
VATGRIAVDLPHSRLLSTAPATGHRAAVGLDWGVKTRVSETLKRVSRFDAISLCTGQDV